MVQTQSLYRAKSAYRPRNAAQKRRRLELKVAQADERYRGSSQALKAEMAAAGHTIGTLRDLDETFANDPLRRHEVMKARVQRWDALWSTPERSARPAPRSCWAAPCWPHWPRPARTTAGWPGSPP